MNDLAERLNRLRDWLTDGADRDTLLEAITTLERHRKTLVHIADAESGIWGTIAHAALHPGAATRQAEEQPDPGGKGRVG